MVRNYVYLDLKLKFSIKNGFECVFESGGHTRLRKVSTNQGAY